VCMCSGVKNSRLVSICVTGITSLPLDVGAETLFAFILAVRGKRGRLGAAFSSIDLSERHTECV
jgi:hypothetical protein